MSPAGDCLTGHAEGFPDSRHAGIESSITTKEAAAYGRIVVRRPRWIAGRKGTEVAAKSRRTLDSEGGIGYYFVYVVLRPV